MICFVEKMICGLVTYFYLLVTLRELVTSAFLVVIYPVLEKLSIELLVICFFLVTFQMQKTVLLSLMVIY